MSTSRLFVAAKSAAHRMAALVALFGTITGGVCAAPQGWAEYRYDRFGLRLEYPADLFVLERQADAGDGHVFVADEGTARLLVGGLVNKTKYAPAEYQEYVARHSYGDYKLGTAASVKHGLCFRARGMGAFSTRK